MSKIGRNDLCPCGSGLKYKKCCQQANVPVPGLEQRTLNALMDRLIPFCEKSFKNELEDALIEFWDDFHPSMLPPGYENTVMINFFEWMVYDWNPDYDSRDTVIDYFLEKEKSLSPLQRELLYRMQESVLCLYEVQEVSKGHWIRIKNLLFEEEVIEVPDMSGSSSLNKWDIIGVRLLWIDNKLLIPGASYQFPVMNKQKILDEINEDYEAYKDEYPNIDMKRYLKDCSSIINCLWTDIFCEETVKALSNTSGDPWLLSKAYYELSDKDEAIRLLTLVKKFHLDDEENKFVWMGKTPKMDNALLGAVSIKGKGLLLECNSKERLFKGKKIIEKALGEVARHKSDSFEDYTQVMANQKEAPPPSKNATKIPKEIETQILQDHLRKHYEKSLTDKIPMLENMTPLEAVKSAHGRKLVIEWLKLLENSMAHTKKQGGACIDMEWMWERLGIPRDNRH